MVFHTNQSLFLEIGTVTSIRALMLKLGDAHEVLSSFVEMAISTDKIETSCLSTSKKMMTIESLLMAHNEHKKTKVDKIDIANLNKKHEALIQKLKMTLTEAKIVGVHKTFAKDSARTVAQNLNRTIADELEISVQMVRKCIDELKVRELC